MDKEWVRNGGGMGKEWGRDGGGLKGGMEEIGEK